MVGCQQDALLSVCVHVCARVCVCLWVCACSRLSSHVEAFPGLKIVLTLEILGSELKVVRNKYDAQV